MIFVRIHCAYIGSLYCLAWLFLRMCRISIFFFLINFNYFIDFLYTTRIFWNYRHLLVNYCNHTSTFFKSWSFGIISLLENLNRIMLYLIHLTWQLIFYGNKKTRAAFFFTKITSKNGRIDFHNNNIFNLYGSNYFCRDNN